MADLSSITVVAAGEAQDELFNIVIHDVRFWREAAIPGTVTFFARAEIIAALAPS